MVDKQVTPITGCYVTDSSGCHRYDYWNEQALFDGRSDTGWCTPSRTVAQLEYLEIDLGGRYEPARLRLQARPIDNHPGFPRSLRVLAHTADQWQPVLAEKDITVRGGEWWERDLTPVATDRLRLEVDEVGLRANGSYFLQFMQLEVLEVAR